MLEDVNDEIPLFTEREQETVLEGEPIGTKVTQVNAIDKDGTFPNNQVRARPTFFTLKWSSIINYDFHGCHNLRGWLNTINLLRLAQLVPTEDIHINPFLYTGDRILGV